MCGYIVTVDFSGKQKIQFSEVYEIMSTLLDYFKLTVSIKISKIKQNHIAVMLSILISFKKVQSFPNPGGNLFLESLFLSKQIDFAIIVFLHPRNELKIMLVVQWYMERELKTSNSNLTKLQQINTSKTAITSLFQYVTQNQ